MFKPTHRFNGADQLEGGEHPLKGCEAMLLRETGESKSGYNCQVRLRLLDFCLGMAQGQKQEKTEKCQPFDEWCLPGKWWELAEKEGMMDPNEAGCVIIEARLEEELEKIT